MGQEIFFSASLRLMSCKPVDRPCFLGCGKTVVKRDLKMVGRFCVEKDQFHTNPLTSHNP